MIHLRRLVTTGLACFFGQFAFAEETDIREWTSSVGSKMVAKAISVSGGKVNFVMASGKERAIPLSKLSAKDQEFLRDFFEVEGGGDAAPEVSNADLPVAKGETVGPIDAGNGSSYFLYLPENLIAKDCPILFWTGSGVSHIRTLNHWKKTADIIGIALACSKEARNGKKEKSNAAHTKDCLFHIRDTIPQIRIQRAIFSGGSGGGVSALINAARYPAIGAVPFIAWMPDDIKLKKDRFFYFGNGAYDFNRTPSAKVVADLGKSATHRFYPGGHTITGWEPAEDGLLWVYTRHLYANLDQYSGEAARFEPRLLKWLTELAESKPHETYYWTDHLLSLCELRSKMKPQFEALHRKVADNPVAVQYLEGRKEIVKFSKKRLASIKRGGSLRGQTNDEIQRAAKRLKAKYDGIADLGQIFEDFAKKTD